MEVRARILGLLCRWVRVGVSESRLGSGAGSLRCRGPTVSVARMGRALRGGGSWPVLRTKWLLYGGRRLLLRAVRLFAPFGFTHTRAIKRGWRPVVDADCSVCRVIIRIKTKQATASGVTSNRVGVHWSLRCVHRNTVIVQ